MKPESRLDLPQGALDFFVQSGRSSPIRGYAIAQRILQMLRNALDVQRGVAVFRAASPRV